MLDISTHRDSTSQPLSLHSGTYIPGYIELVIPEVTSSLRMFIGDQHGSPISVAGIQYRLRQYCQIAGVTLTWPSA